MSEIQELKSMAIALQGIEEPRTKELLRIMIDNIRRLDHNASHHADNPVPTEQLDTPFIYPEEVLWTDYLSPMAQAEVAAGSPSMLPFGPSGNLKALNFTTTGAKDAVMQYFHINHDIKMGTNIYPHVHWSTDGINTGAVGWNIEYSIAKGHNQEAFPAPTTFTLSEAASGITWQHMITEASDAQSFEAPEVDSIVMMRIEIDSNATGDLAFGLFVDLHTEIDRPGTPNKAPDFYKT